MKLIYYILLIGVCLIAIVAMDFHYQNDIQKWCQTQHYEISNIDHKFFNSGPFILSGKGYSIYEVKVEGSTFWFRYSIFGRDIYQLTNGYYQEIK